MKRLNGPLLRSLRQNKGLNVSGLATAADVDRRTVASYERLSPEKIDLNTVTKLASFFGLTLDGLLVDSPHPEAATPAPALATA